MAKKVQALGQKLCPWSFSKLSTFEECPAKAKFQYIDKVRTPEKAVFIKGNKAHKILEEFIESKYQINPMSMNILVSYLKQLGITLTAKPKKELSNLSKMTKLIPVKTELKWGFSKNWGVLNDWFDSGVYCRMVVDLFVMTNDFLGVVDYKTGRMYDHHKDQSSLYALGAMKYAAARDNKAEEVRVSFLYLEHNAVETKIYNTNDMKEMEAEWTKRAETMLSAETLPENLGPACKWCDYKNICQAHGGNGGKKGKE